MKEKHKDQFKTIATNLRRIRDRKGFSQQDVANRCDIDRAKISRIENAAEDFMFSTLIELASALEVNIDDFLREDS